MAGDGGAHGHRAGVSVLAVDECSDKPGTPAGNGEAQARRLGRDDDMFRVDADTQWLVASVLTDRPVGEFTGDQERESVRRFGTAGCITSPGEDWQPVGIRSVRNTGAGSLGER